MHRLRILGAALIAATATGSAIVLHRPAPPAAVDHGAPAAALAAGHQLAASAPDQAVRLQALLGQHSVLAADLMRSRVRGDDDFVQAANAALNRNTDEMAALVRQLFGDAAAQAFAPLWSGHVVGLVAYAGAVADRDAAARERARADLNQAETQLGDFFAAPSQGRLPQAAARAALTQHVRHLTQQLDAYAAGDYAASDRAYREGFAHTYELGLTLARALLPEADSSALAQPVWRLRSRLGALLAEHSVLIGNASRAAVMRAPDFTAAAAQVDANTRDLTAAIDVLFGSRAAQQFGQLWAEHVDQLVGYAAAGAAQDPERQRQARATLDDFETGMSAFLGAATGDRIPDRSLGAALREHDQMLLRHADAYAARDFAGAHDIAYRTYGHMFDLARTLADAFGAEAARRLPVGGAATGYGGLARKPAGR